MHSTEHTLKHRNANLTHSFARGCEKAFGQIFNELNPILTGYAYKIIKDEAEAQDIAAGIFIKLWERHKNFHSMGSIRSFMLISVRNACINHLSKQKTRKKVKNEIYLLSNDASEDYVLNDIVREEELKELYVEIEKLPVQCRKIFVKALCAGKTNEEIAEEMGISIHTVRNQKVRGKGLVEKRIFWKNKLAQDRINIYLNQ